MDYARRGVERNMPGMAAVLVVHLLVGYAVVTGLARKVIDVVKAPLEAKMIEETRKPPPELPPPPPPKLAAPPPPFIPPPEINIQVPVAQAAPAITTQSTTPAPKVAPPVAPAPQPLVRKEYKASYRVEPAFPRKAVQQGLDGRVIAWVHVEPSGAVSQVEIKRSTSHIFDQEVVRALSQWKFNPEPVGFIGEYEISFMLKD